MLNLTYLINNVNRIIEAMKLPRLSGVKGVNEILLPILAIFVQLIAFGILVSERVLCKKDDYYKRKR